MTDIPYKHKQVKLNDRSNDNKLKCKSKGVPKSESTNSTERGISNSCEENNRKPERMETAERSINRADDTSYKSNIGYGMSTDDVKSSKCERNIGLEKVKAFMGQLCRN